MPRNYYAYEENNNTLNVALNGSNTIGPESIVGQESG
jgi:hypothetical protein